MKRNIALLLALFIALGLLAACGDSKLNDTTSGASDVVSTASGVTSSKETISDTVPDDIVSSDDVKYLDGDGKSVYTVVYPKEPSKGEKERATHLAAQMKTAFGAEVVFDTDEGDGTDKYEILVGDTNRPETETVKSFINDTLGGKIGDYAVCTVEKKIVIYGASTSAIEAACTYFLQNCLIKEGIGGGISHSHKTEQADYPRMTVNGYELSKYSLVRDMSTRSWLIQEEARKLISLISDETGKNIPLLDDKETTESEFEISIGNTNRSGVTPQSDYSYDEYEVLISDKKVYLMGGSTYAVQVAVTEFCKMVENGAVTDEQSTTGSYSATVNNYDGNTYYQLVWGDEFDGETLDTTKWSITETEYKGAQLVVTDRTFAIDNGILKMKGYKDGNQYIHCDAIQSSGKFRYHGGYIEMRARIPDIKGVYSSFWGNGKNAENTGDLLEIDIFESLGSAHKQQANLHKWYANGQHWSLDGRVKERYYTLPEKEGTLFDDFHVIGMLWTDEEIHFYYDGYEYYLQEIDDFYSDKYINIYAGFNIGWNDRTAPADDTEYPLEYHIDYIRLFQVCGKNIIEKK